MPCTTEKAQVEKVNWQLRTFLEKCLGTLGEVVK